MLRFVVRRLLLLIPILIGLSILVFLWIRALPGGPAQALLGERATAESIQDIEQQYGLNEPIYTQYWTYISKVAQGDLGTSVTTRRPVVDELEQRFPATIELAFAAMLFATFLGVPLGFIAAKKLRHGDRPCQPGPVPARDLDPRLLPRDPAQVRLRGAARAVTHRRPDLRDDRSRAPDELLRARRRSSPSTRRRSGTCSST